MHQGKEQPFRLKMRPSEACCAQCPPDRVCAWACVQGAGYPDIVVGAMLEQGESWVLRDVVDPALEAINQALWESFNG